MKEEHTEIIRLMTSAELLHVFELHVFELCFALLVLHACLLVLATVSFALLD